ncbi:MAG: helix-turn-helix domain-containing protein [Patescibacteria group bacterium]|jgi:sugar-specific transcriptional regulator TrmB
MKIEKVLEKHGLNEKQIKVYLSSLELGPASVKKISQKAGLVRTTVYEVLESLKQKRFVNSFLKKTVKYYNAEDPEQIIRLAKNNIEDLQGILPELKALGGEARQRPAIRFYQGQDGIKLIMEEILKEAKELISFGSSDDLFREMGEYHQSFLKRRIEKKIPLRVILKDTPRSQARKDLEKQQLRQVKLLSPSSEFNGLIYVWENKIAMLSFKNDLIGIVVESKVLAETERELLNGLWNNLYN